MGDTDNTGVVSGAAYCVPCAGGTYSERDRSVLCAVCDVSTGYSSDAGATSCEKWVGFSEDIDTSGGYNSALSTTIANFVTKMLAVRIQALLKWMSQPKSKR